MDRNRSHSAWRSSALAAALFAITFNFLQPLGHAALMRLGTPQAIWSVLCNSAAADPARHDSAPPASAHDHDCCLGLAHATPLVEPSAAFAVVERPAAAAMPLPLVAQPASVGIRDGPCQPRGPPLLV